MIEQDVVIEKIEMIPGKIEIQARHPAIAIIATELAKLLKEQHAENFVTISMSDGNEMFEVTVRRANGKTPAEKMGEMQREIDELRKDNQ